MVNSPSLAGFNTSAGSVRALTCGLDSLGVILVIDISPR
jgi:hypothetical protein